MATPNRQDVLNLLQERKGLWRQRYGITHLGLFGSLARGEAGPDSDVDLCVSLDPPNPFCLGHFKQEVEQALQVPVDVISLWDRMNPALRRRAVSVAGRFSLAISLSLNNFTPCFFTMDQQAANESKAVAALTVVHCQKP